MRKYLNSVDYIVFGVSIICLLWITFYKLSWLNLDPLFGNADKWADITYTVFTSIFAAGLFYLLTIFTPKIPKLKKMRKQLSQYMNEYDRFTVVIISKIINSSTKSPYTLDSYLEILKKGNFQSTNYKQINKDFKIAFGLVNNPADFNRIMSIMNQYLNNILILYKDIIPSDIYAQILDACNLMFTSLEPINTINTTNIKTHSNNYFNVFNQLIVVGFALKSHDYLKEWNNTMTM